MYVYKITNKINNKKYIGITNNIEKRWGNERSYPSNPKRRQVIQEAIHKYGVDNFNFEIIKRGLSIEEAVKMEKELIDTLNTLVPNGYNVHPGGEYHPVTATKKGADNPNAKLTEQEAQYILDNRDKPIYLLYEDFNEKISYEAFKKIYHHITYTNLTTSTSEYPYNREFSCQFTSGPLEYDDVVKLRERYSNGEYWREVYKDYIWVYNDEWTFWNVYYGNRYKLVMPEVFTEENRHKHAGMSKSGSLNGRAKLNEEDVLMIRKRWSEGATRKELYEAYPQVSQVSIRDIINGKTWKHLL
jgi:group I intron endonuclease